MIPLMALMIGFYIVTKMMIFILDKNPSQYQLGVAINKPLAAATIFVTVVCVVLILFPDIGRMDMENTFKSDESLPGSGELERSLWPTEETKLHLVIIEPAELYRDDFKTTWPADKIPAGTKLEILNIQVRPGSIPKLKIVFYKVKYKGIHGWVMEDNCKIIT